MIVTGGRLLEREEFLAAATDLVEGTRSGRGGALFVVGDAGLGKTTCLARTAALAGPTVRVGVGRGDVMETSLPFGVFTTALQAAGYHELVPASPARGGFGDARANHFYGVLSWLENTTGPVLLALDDLHWADPDSLALLSFLCRRLAGLPVAVLGTLRPWPPAADELARALAYDRCAVMHQLAPLSEEAASALLAARLGEPLAEAESRATTALCAGNPLLLEQVAVSMNRQRWTGDLIKAGAAGPEGIVLTRFAGLPATALRVARAASVLGTRFRPRLAMKVAGLDEQQAEGALEALCASGLVQARTTTTAEFVHPLMCQSLYHDMAAPVRARLHARAFAALCEHGLETEAVEHAIRGDLVGDPAAILTAERAGRAALALGALDTAVEHLRTAGRLAGERASPALLLTLGEVLVIGGQPAEAATVYEQLRARPDLDPVDRIRTLWMLSRALFVLADYDQAIRRLREAATVAEGYSETALAEVLVGTAVAFLFTLGPTHSLPLAIKARALAVSAPGPLCRQATATWGLAASLAGDPAGLAACEAAVEDLVAEPSESPEVRWGYGPRGALAAAALFAERFADAERELGIVLALADRIGAAEARVTHLIIKAVVAMRQGRLAEALAGVEQAEPLADLMPHRKRSTGFVKAEVLLLMGRLAECAEWCRRNEAEADAWGQGYVLLPLWHVRAQLEHHGGDLAGACALYERIEQVAAQMGITEPCAVPWARHAVLAYVADGRLDDARRVIRSLERSAERLPCRWPRIAAATGHAALAEVGGDFEDAERRYEDALALHLQVELPVELAETLLSYGTFLRRRGQPVRSRPHLAKAMAIAESCGAGWLAHRAHHELVVAGGRRRRPREDPTRLTAQEQRVACLTAAGYSNKAIAGLLSLSTKTVEHHLAQVYTKLGITSRRDLMTGRHDL